MRQRIGPWGIALGEKLRGLARDQSVREALFVFALTRTLVFAIFIVAGAATLDATAPGFDREDPHPVASVRTRLIKQQLEHTLGRGDSSWYALIAQQGYDRVAFEARPQHNWVFFPLYPLLVRLGGGLTGEYLIWGALLSNGLFFIALILLHKLVTALGHDESTAGRAVFYTAAFPVSYFFSLPVTEALYLCLVVGSFLAAARGRWWAAGVIGGFASATRLAGVLLLPALALFYGQRVRRSRWGRDMMWLALVPVGLLAFMLFLWRITGNPLAFVDAIAAWERPGGFFLLTLYDYLKHPLRIIQPWDFRTLNFGAAILALGAVYFWARRKQWALATFAFLAILLPLSSGTLQSTARYVAVIFPVFIALAVAGRRPRVDQVIRAVFLVLLAVMTLSYTLRFSFAAA